MSDLFEIYQSNLKKVLSDVSKNLDTIKVSPTEDLIKQLDFDLKECDKLIKNLEIQISTSPDPNYSLYVKNFKGGYEQYRKKFNKERQKFYSEQNAQLLSLQTDNGNSIKDALNEEIAYKTFDKLEQAKRATLSIENTGTEVMMEMHYQSNHMKEITGKVGNVGEQITSSSSLIDDMESRTKKNKNIIIIFGLALLLIFLGILIFRFVPRTTTGGHQETTDLVPKSNSTNTV